MRAISLWEPWASGIFTGAKRFETRSWPTKYRGPLLICAAKGGLSKGELLAFLSCWDWQGALAPLKGRPLDLTFHSWPGVDVENLFFGKAVAIVDLADCIPTDKLTLAETAIEHHFGDFSLGRFAWKLENLRPLKTPFPVKGRQGFFNIPDVDIAFKGFGSITRCW